MQMLMSLWSGKPAFVPGGKEDGCCYCWRIQSFQVQMGCFGGRTSAKHKYYLLLNTGAVLNAIRAAEL